MISFNPTSQFSFTFTTLIVLLVAALTSSLYTHSEFTAQHQIIWQLKS